LDGPLFANEADDAFPAKGPALATDGEHPAEPRDADEPVAPRGADDERSVAEEPAFARRADDDGSVAEAGDSAAEEKETDGTGAEDDDTDGTAAEDDDTDGTASASGVETTEEAGSTTAAEARIAARSARRGLITRAAMLKTLRVAVSYPSRKASSRSRPMRYHWWMRPPAYPVHAMNNASKVMSKVESPGAVMAEIVQSE
jgi:hypothetical protein